MYVGVVETPTFHHAEPLPDAPLGTTPPHHAVDQPWARGRTGGDPCIAVGWGRQLVVTGGAARAIESGRTVRIDSTVMTGWLHAPTDSSLLVDGIRVLLRLLRRVEHRTGFTAYHPHLKRAKRRLLAIQHAASHAAGARRRAYRDLLTLAQATADYAACALGPVQTIGTAALGKLSPHLAHYLPLVQQVIAQTERRVFHHESVPASEEVVSLFEPHTDVLVKDRHETYYGHKIFLTGGASGLILDCAVTTDNPADATWAVPMLRRQRARLRTRAPSGQLRRRVCLAGQSHAGPGARGPRRVLCQTARLARPRYGEEQLGLSEAPRVPRGDRERDLLPETGVWARPLHLEG